MFRRCYESCNQGCEHLWAWNFRQLMPRRFRLLLKAFTRIRNFCLRGKMGGRGLLGFCANELCNFDNYLLSFEYQRKWLPMQIVFSTWNDYTNVFIYIYIRTFYFSYGIYQWIDEMLMENNQNYCKIIITFLYFMNILFTSCFHIIFIV